MQKKGQPKIMKTMKEDRADYSLFQYLQRLTWLMQKAFLGSTGRALPKKGQDKGVL